MRRKFILEIFNVRFTATLDYFGSESQAWVSNSGILTDMVMKYCRMCATNNCQKWQSIDTLPQTEKKYHNQQAIT